MVASTQDRAAELLDQGSNEGVVVTAAQQTGGRGRFGHKWISPIGNVYMSFVLRPEQNEDVGHYAFILAVGLKNALQSFAPHRTFQLKWPNDVLCDGKKISGILLEAYRHADGSLKGMIAGVGINVLTQPETGTSLGLPASVDAVRSKALEAFGESISLYREQGFAPIRESWLASAYNVGQSVKVRLPNEVKEGVFESLSEDGALMLRQDNTVTPIYSGEMVLDL